MKIVVVSDTHRNFAVLNEIVNKNLDAGLFIHRSHGPPQHVHDGLDRLVSDAKDNDCRIALFGHTHLYRTENIDGVFLMNPGSPDCPRNHNKPTYGVIELDSEGGIQMNIVAVGDK